VIDSNGQILLPGGSTIVKSWGLGRRYTDDHPKGLLAVGNLKPPRKDSSLLMVKDKFFWQAKPQYQDKPSLDFLSVLWFGVKNDGSNAGPNTQNINKALKEAARLRKVLVFPAGVYKVSDTIFVPPESKIVGALWSQIMADGKQFEDKDNPRILVK
jgi:glucan 1,3-beta-glucosidase